MGAHINILKDTAFELYLDTLNLDTAAEEKNEALEQKAIDRKNTEQWRPLVGRMKSDGKGSSLALIKLLEDIRSTFAHTTYYLSSDALAMGAYNSFTMHGASKPNPLDDKAGKTIFRKAGIFQRIFPFQPITVRYNPDTTEANDTRELARKILSLFIPGFSIANTWVRDPESRNKPVALGGQTDHTITLSDLLKVIINPKDSSYRPKKEDDFTFANLKYWGPRIRFRFQSSASYSGGYSFNNTGETGEINYSRSSGAIITIIPSVEVDFDERAMAWALSATDASEITVYDVLRHIEPYENSVYKLGGRGLNMCRERTAALGALLKTVGRINRTIGSSKPRMNSDGFGIFPDGSVKFFDYKPDLPSDFNPARDKSLFFTAMQESYNKDTGTLKLTRDIANIPLVVDWSAGVMVWTNDSVENINNTTIQDITEVRALKESDVGLHLRRPLLDSQLFFTAFSHAIRIVNSLGMGMEYETRLYDASNPFMGYNKVFKDKPPTAMNLFNEIYTDNQDNEVPSATRYLQKIGEMIRTAYQRFDETNPALSTKHDILYPLALFGKYAAPENYKPFFEADKQVTEEYKRKLTEEDRYSTPTLYNLSGITHMMPHQQEIYNTATYKDLPNILLGAAAGSGKTLMYTSYAMYMLHSDKVKRPLVVMPRPLLRQFQPEVMGKYSQGKIRVFPIYLSVWKRWNSLGLTFEDIASIINSQPKNTIFVTDYNFLKYQPETLSLGIHSVASYPIARWMSNLFDFIIEDESHKGKNAGTNNQEASAVSRAVGALVTYTEDQLLASGTMVHNTSLDVLGQVMKTSPATFEGSIDRFVDQGGKLLKSNMLEDFVSTISERHGYFSATNKRWSFLLPKVFETMHTVGMTPNQQRFYNKKLSELVGALEASQEYKEAQKKDHENNNTSQQEFLLNRELSGFEIFLGAPDETAVSLSGRHPLGAEFTTLPTTQGEDLISPKVRRIDEIIAAHFAGGEVGDSGIKVEKSNAKIIVFGYNIAIPKHIYKHSKYRDIMVHYEAEGDAGLEKIDRFINDPKVKILVACEKTLSEGFNLQVASRVIVTQPGWTPGDFEQKISRVLRPDVPDENGKLKYDRRSIDLDWVLCEPSFEIAKTARLMVKFLDKAKFDEYDTNPRFKAWIKANPYDEIALFTMNIASIVEMQTFDSLTPYRDMYAKLRDFQDREYDIEKRYVWKRTILRLGLATKERLAEITKMEEYKQDAELEKILSATDLRAKAMIKVESKDMAGYTDEHRADFTRGYLPLVPGATLIDPYGLGLMPVASIVEKQVDDKNELVLSDDDEDEDEDENSIEFNTQVEEGEIVATEFGLGVAGRQRSARGGEGFSPNIPVYIDGIGKDRINMPATLIFVPKDKAQKDRLRAIYNDLKKNKRPTNTLTIDANSVTVNDITVASDKIAAGRPPMKAMSPNRIREGAVEAISTPMPIPPNMTVKPPITAPVRPTAAPAKAGPPVIVPSTKAGTVPPRIAPPIKMAPTVQPVKPAAEMVRAPIKPPIAIKPPAAAVAAPKKMSKQDAELLNQPFEAITLNNQITALTNSANDKFDALVESKGFTRIGESVMAQVMNLQGLINIVAYLKKTYYIPDEYIEEMDKAVAALEKGKASIAKLTPSLGRQREFLLLSNKKKIVDAANEAHPIILVDDNIIYILIETERFRGPRKLLNRMVVKNVAAFKSHPPMFLKFYTSVSKLIDDLEDLESQGVTIKNEKALSKDIKALSRS